MSDTLNIENQPILSFGRTLQLTADGLRYRLFRAMVTVAVVAVAVAFLANILSGALFRRSVAEQTRAEIAESRLMARWVARLSAAGTRESLVHQLSKAEDGHPLLAESAALGGLSNRELNQLRKAATEAARYLRFLNELEYDQRRRLVHRASGCEVFDRLSDTEAMAVFRDELGRMPSVRLEGTLEQWGIFLTAWPSVRADLDRVLAGRARAIQSLQPVLANRTAAESLCDADGGFGKAVQAAGFGLVQTSLVARQARDARDSERVETWLQNDRIRRTVARHVRERPGRVSSRHLWALLDDPDRAEAIRQAAQQHRPDTDLPETSRLVHLAETRNRQMLLSRVQRLTADVGDGVLGVGRRTAWLVVVSMLVCAVGICNSMLVSVTERFREIATLKCLGALDRFIMLVFVLEACFIGLAGGIVGALAGVALGWGRTILSVGLSFVPATPVTAIALSALAATGAGVMLAALSALYPSWRAARLAPMEAMRVE